MAWSGYISDLLSVGGSELGGAEVMFPRFSGVGLLDDHHLATLGGRLCPGVTRPSSGGKFWI